MFVFTDYCKRFITNPILKLLGYVASMDDNYIIWWASYNGYSPIVKFISMLPSVDPTICDNNPIVCAAGYGHLKVVKHLLTLPGVDVTAQDNQAIIWATRSANLTMIKYLSTLPGVDASAQDNSAIKYAICFGCIEILDYLLTLPGVDASARDNDAIMWASKIGSWRTPMLARLLYYEHSVYSTLSNKDYINIHRKIISKLRPVVHKIAISLTDLPTPILIEIIEQATDFAIYIPYHIKWNMVVAIKHNQHIKHNKS